MLADFEFNSDSLSLTWSDGSTDAFISDWLLDNDPGQIYNSGQKSGDIRDIPDSSYIDDVRVAEAGLTLEFAPDNREVFFPFDRLKGQSQPEVSDRSEWAKKLWDNQLLKELPCWEYNEFANDDHCRLQALEAFLKSGVFLLDNVPQQPGIILEVIRLFGFVRETNYGSLFDVQSTIDPRNQAFTRLGLNQHTDNPYRDPVPSIQLLHCLSNSSEGGESFLLDGFMAASQLRELNPSAFKALNELDIPFSYQDDDTLLKSSVRLIETGCLGDIRKVRFNDRSISTIRLPLEQQRAFYSSFRFWSQLLHDPALRLYFKLSPGELVVFDNTRIMHGREAYTAAGHRHLQGAYSDLDGLFSTLYILRRKCQ